MATINRRRAASKEISSTKKTDGHKVEQEYANLISGTALQGTGKGDVKDFNGLLHSVKSGKKLQIFLYSYSRISSSKNLSILLPCLKVFPNSFEVYNNDRETCIEYKEKFLRNHGKEAAKKLTNEQVLKEIGPNKYAISKMALEKITKSVSMTLENKQNLSDFLDEAIFNINDVSYLVVKDSTYKKDSLFKVFYKKDVLKILTENLIPSVSSAGKIPQDFNVAGQKILLRYNKEDGKLKNICEIEIRNERLDHYRQVRFNMYSRDLLLLLIKSCKKIKKRGKVVEYQI